MGQPAVKLGAFEGFLLDGLTPDNKAKALTLRQISQLLLLRHGLYNQVGVYFDASASAYQILGLIHQDAPLTHHTNLTKANTNKSGLYAQVLNLVNETFWISSAFKACKLEQRHKIGLQRGHDRKLIQAIVTRLVYGKTRLGLPVIWLCFLTTMASRPAPVPWRT